MSGRKKDGIWQHFIEKTEQGKTGKRAICKTCKKEIQGLVTRLKNHREMCKPVQSNNEEIDARTDEDQDALSVSVSAGASIVSPTSDSTDSMVSTCKASTSSFFTSKKRKLSGSLDKFVVRTSLDKKYEIDKQIAKAIFATNSSFRCVENVQVKKAIEMLRPGYSLPSRKVISTSLLDEIYKEEKESCFKNLSQQCVNLSIDGWSNVHNEPVICSTITTEDGRSFLYETLDTSGHPHTSEYLTEIVSDLIASCRTKYNCSVTSFVTDNAANMARMRNSIENATTSKVITYGCSAHILNLLCKDLEIKDIKENIVHVVKYFRNNHLARARYKQAEGKTLVLPSDVRWNSLANCLDIYVSNWEIMLRICEENKKEIDPVVFEKVSNIGLKRSAEDYLKILKPIAAALDKLQKKNAFLSDAVETWKDLEMIFEDGLQLTLQQNATFQKRQKQALTPYHYIAYMLDPTKQKHKISEAEKSVALETIQEMYGNSGLLPLVIKLEAKMEPFKKVMFSEEILHGVTSLQWWVSQKDVSDIANVLTLIKQFLCAVSSSASVERVFSSFGLVHSNLRNKLGVEKAGKLVFLYKYYNEN